MTNISAHAERVAKHYWGEPNAKLSIKGRTLRWGTHGSKELDLQKSTYYDFELCEGGGVVDIVRNYGKVTISGSVAETLEREFGIQRQAQKSLVPKQYISKIYEYYNADGELGYQVLRYEPKTFRQRRPDGNGGWLNSVKDVEPLPYNLMGIMQNPDAPIFIVEGEKAADALIKIGFVATTNSGGAGNFKPELADYFDGRNVVILPDNDNAGEQHADKVTRTLWGRASKIKVVSLSGLPPKGDVVDWLAQGNDAATLGEAVAKASAVTEADIHNPDPELVEEIVADADGSEIVPFEVMTTNQLKAMPPVTWAVDGLVTLHGFTVMYGAPASGKSFLAIDMALSIANGLAWQNRAVRRGSVLYIAGEGVGGMGKRVKAWEAWHGKHDTANLYVLPTAVNFRDEADIARLKMTIDSIGEQFTMVVVDTVARALLGGEENSATDMGLFVAACDQIKAHTGSALLAVHHAGKDSAKGMRGSSSLLGGVDAAMSITNFDGIVTLKVEKQKDAEVVPDMNFEMVPVATIDDQSVVMVEVGADEVKDKKRKNKAATPLTTDQQFALEALQNAIIDAGQTSINVDVWHTAHSNKCPDVTAGKRRDARSALQDKRVIAIENKKVWIING
jgi:hypothetical protein